MIRIQEGIRIKSKDMHFGVYIFYLALNIFIDNFINTKKVLLENYFLVEWFIYLLIKIKELAVSQWQAHDDLVNSDFLMLTS